MPCQLDHLVVTSASLEQGCDWVEALLGVRPQGGGQHQGMATHNRLLKLGPRTYLEVIAPDPNAPPAVRRRWFAMDQAHTLAQPRLATWVVRSSDILASVSGLNPDPGPVIAMQRGDWHWQITVPVSGDMGFSGLFPTLIQWLSPHRHPADLMPDSACCLSELVLQYPNPDEVQHALQALALTLPSSLSLRLTRGLPSVSAVIQTPAGERQLLGGQLT